MTVDSVFSIISGLSTAIATILVFFTLLEMIRERKTTYQPELLPENFKKLDNDNNITDCENTYPKSIEGMERIKIVNIGLGAAKDININFGIDIAKIVEHINQNDFKKKYRIEFNNENGFSSIESNGFKLMINIKNDLRCNIDHILPLSSDSVPVCVDIPHSYLYFLFIALDTTSLEHLFNDKNSSLMDIVLDITYKDLGNNQIKKKYKMTPRIRYMHSSKDKEIEDLSGDFIICKI